MKTIYKLLETKQKKRTSFFKSDEYTFFSDHKIMLGLVPRFAFLGKTREEFKIMRANIILQGLISKEMFENEMQNFSNYVANGVAIDHGKLLNSLKEKMIDQPYFQEDKIKIYIPFFSRSINSLYLWEPEKLLVSPYKELKSVFADNTVDPFDTYGCALFDSKFTRLLKVGTNGKEVAFFHYDTNTIYIVNNQGRLDVKIVLFDKYLKRPSYSHMLERIAPVVQAYFDNDRTAMINALHDQKLISPRMLYLIHRRGKSE